MSIADKIVRINESVAVQTNAIDTARTLLAMKTTEPQPAFEDNNCRKWTVTISEDSAAGSTISITAADEWLAAHRSDTSLSIALIPLNTMSVAAKSIISAVQGNRLIWADKYGRCMHGNSGGTAISSNNYVRSITDNGAPDAIAYGFAVTSAGNLTFGCRDGGGTLVLPAGKWLVVATIDDEEESE